MNATYFVPSLLDEASLRNKPIRYCLVQYLQTDADTRWSTYVANAFFFSISNCVFLKENSPYVTI